MWELNPPLTEEEMNRIGLYGVEISVDSISKVVDYEELEKMSVKDKYLSGEMVNFDEVEVLEAFELCESVKNAYRDLKTRRDFLKDNFPQNGEIDGLDYALFKLGRVLKLED